MIKDMQTLPQGLTLDEGISHEVAIEKLNNAGIVYEIRWDKRDSRSRYFRSSDITVNSHSHLNSRDYIAMPRDEKEKLRGEASIRVIEALGFPDHHNSGNLSYYSAYKIGEGFLWDGFSGTVTFNQGRLVERVIIYFD